MVTFLDEGYKKFRDVKKIRISSKISIRRYSKLLGCIV
jgi:hypothetical protein